MSKDFEIELTEKFRGVIFKTNYIVPSTVNDRRQKVGIAITLKTKTNMK